MGVNNFLIYLLSAIPLCACNVPNNIVLCWEISIKASCVYTYTKTKWTNDRQMYMRSVYILYTPPPPQEMIEKTGWPMRSSVRLKWTRQKETLHPFTFQPSHTVPFPRAIFFAFLGAQSPGVLNVSRAFPFDAIYTNTHTHQPKKRK